MRRTLTRRTLLRSAAAVAVAACARPALALAQPLARRPAPRAKNVVLLWLDGGPSHLETFDPKSDCGDTFPAIATATDGMRFSERLPLLAARTRRLAIVRSLSAPTADHARARELGLTGHLPAEVIVHPLFLCSAASELADFERDLPAVVTIGDPLATAGHLGERFDPFVVAEPTSAARKLTPRADLTAVRRHDREALLDRMDRRFGAAHDLARLHADDALKARARRLSTAEVAAAFDLDHESAERTAAYGPGPIGRSCQLARRLLEHGVRFVAVRSAGWDTHSDNLDVTGKLLADLDPALAALLDDLAASGLLDETLVLAYGEFGRTPEINNDLGRDHHWRCFSALVAGGGVRGGQVVGVTDSTGHEVVERPVAVPDLLASVYFALGLDPRRTFVAPTGRPVQRLESGEPIHELFA